jgi:hypothetical protein
MIDLRCSDIIVFITGVLRPPTQIYLLLVGKVVFIETAQGP